MAKLPITQTSTATDNIQSLPNQVKGQAATVKLAHDQYGIDNNAYVNNTLIAELNGDDGSKKIGHNSTSVTADNVGEAIEENRQSINGVVLGQIPDDSLTNDKLSPDVKVGSLATLTTEDKNSVVNAINEVKNISFTDDNAETKIGLLFARITNLSQFGSEGNTLQWTNPVSDEFLETKIFRAEKDISDFTYEQLSTDVDVTEVYSDIGTGSGGTNTYIDPYNPAPSTQLWYKAIPCFIVGGTTFRSTGNTINYNFSPVTELYLHQEGVKIGSWTANIGSPTVTINLISFDFNSDFELENNESFEWGSYNRVDMLMRVTSGTLGLGSVGVRQTNPDTNLSLIGPPSLTSTFQTVTYDITALTGSSTTRLFEFFRALSATKILEVKDVRLFVE